MDAKDSLMLLEYERSSEFCNHVDGVRNVITSFFLTVVGAAAFYLDRFSSGDLKTGQVGSPSTRVIGLLCLVSVIGLLFVLVIARLRRVQLERYVVMNGILDHILMGETRKLIPFVNARIAGSAGAGAIGRRTTGSYFWTLIIVLPATLLVGTASSLVFGLMRLNSVALPLLSIICAVLYAVVCDLLYFRLSR
ncbi:MAG: hypothetical protein H0T54_05090 [Geodermatophilaceae bacterium]|nr:hypothetical protein [Geodermatophilaceae bacterium]